jgi:lipoprotein-anchoring transpeptidase ErfK/SrfK
MRTLATVIGVLIWATATTVFADKVDVAVDISKQKMNVYVDGHRKYTWKVSTAREGYSTPSGDYRPLWITRMHYSRKYDNSPMPYSVFYNGGYAIHGTNYVSRLGRPASHGCIRVHTSNARRLYNLVKKYGKKNVRIMVRREIHPSMLASHFKGPFAVGAGLFN